MKNYFCVFLKDRMQIFAFDLPRFPEAGSDKSPDEALSRTRPGESGLGFILLPT